MTAAGICPDLPALEAFAAGGCTDESVAAHVGACPACSAAVARAREINTFLADVRPVLAGQHASEPAPRLLRESIKPNLVSGYQILEEIHRGGQGVVYRALQVQTQRIVAIKMLLAGRGTAGRDRERFEREARIAAGLRHPNIVTVYDSVCVPDGRLAFAMEFIEGQPLDRWSAGLTRDRDDRRRVLRERLALMGKVCDAVLYAHQHAIVHRDLKPANILVDDAGEPHVLDFGIARDLGPEERTRLTHTGAFAGTLAYASPEQVSGDPSRVDARTDIYSLGVIMYEMVAGRMPYAVDGAMGTTIRNIETVDPVPLSRRTRDGSGPFADDDVSTIILKAMAKDPARRYQTAAGLGNDIKRYFAGEAIEARRDSTWYVLRKTAAQHRLALLTAGLIFAGLAVFGLVMAWQRERLAVALSDSTIERGRAGVQLANISEAESLLWGELLRAPRAGSRWNPDDERLPLSRAWWALWELYAAHPCAATIRTTPSGTNPTNLLMPVPGHDDLILIGGGAGTVELRSLPDLLLRAEATNPVDPKLGRPAAFWTGAFAPGGVLVTTASDNVIRGWDAMTLKPLRGQFALTSLELGNYSPSSVSQNGARIAVRDSSSVRLLDLDTGSLLETIPIRPTSMLLSPDGQWLALWDETGVTVHQVGAPEAADRLYHAPAARARNMAFIPNHGAGAPGLIATDGAVVLKLDPDRPGEAHQFAEVENVPGLTCIALSADGQWLAAAGVDRRISLWDARGTAGVLARPYISTHDSEAKALTFTRDNRSLLSAHDDGVVQRWDLSELASPRRRGAFTSLEGHEDSVFAVAIAPTVDGPRGYSGAYDRTVRAWDLRSGRQTGCSGPLDGQVESIAISPDGRTVAAAIDVGDHGDVVLLDADTLHSRARIENAHAVRCSDLDFSPDGAALLTAGDDGFVCAWSVDTRKRTARQVIPNRRGDRFPNLPVHTIRFSPDGETIGWGGAGGLVNLTDASLAAAARNLPGNRQIVRCVRFSPDGQRLAAAGNDATVWIWDVATGRALHEMKGHMGSAYSVAFSPDGRLLASGASDGTVRLWNAATGTNLAVLRDGNAARSTGWAIFAIQFTPDGDHLFIGGTNGYLGIWDLRHCDGYIAGNLEYQLNELQSDGRSSSIAVAARRWAGKHRYGPQSGK
ncbi:MAG: protein kinase [Phycisphaerales bacterium]|nr:protein kinase [Phycisphaerales bacterium]